MITLVDVEDALTLFAEGIGGRYYHVKATSEFASRQFELTESAATMATDTLYLPDTLDHLDGSAYRVLAMQQLAQREFGTFEFRLAVAAERIDGIDPDAAQGVGARHSDFTAFFCQVAHPPLLRALFQATENARVTARLLGRYPGLARHLSRFREREHATVSLPPIHDLTTLVMGYTLLADGFDPARLDDDGGLLAAAGARLARHAEGDTDVVDSAALALDLYNDWSALLSPLDLELPGQAPGESELEWLQREARLEDWEETFQALEQNLEVTLLEGAEVTAAQVDGLEDASIRDADVDVKALTDERDNLRRRMDMERAAIREALGSASSQTRSYRYDEWNYLERRYLKHWCRLFEERLQGDPSADPQELKRVIQRHSAAVARQLEQIRPLGFQRVRRTQDGDELDFNALIDTRQDVRAGVSPDERVYSRRDRVHRDVCAAFLVDLSASTDDPIEPPEPPPPLPDDDGFAVNLRDPYDDDVSLAHEVGAEPRRRIIDVSRESMLVMSAALERLGDSYGIYGFSGYGRDCVEFYVAKEPAEPFNARTLEAIAAMRPRRSTRMGPAIRHTVTKLLASGNALKLLVILSDGFPQDSDYGPERGNHEYGLADTAKALGEAEAKGIEVFCVTVDKSGNDYLKRMCPANRYLVIDEIEDLPERLSTVYQTLTGR
jgi:hypothetical protein